MLNSENLYHFTNFDMSVQVTLTTIQIRLCGLCRKLKMYLSEIIT